jgi:hypothetical protein
MESFTLLVLCSRFIAILTHLPRAVNVSTYSGEETISNFDGKVYHDKFFDSSQYLQACMELGFKLSGDKFISLPFKCIIHCHPAIRPLL